jgi:hypothetical protein
MSALDIKLLRDARRLWAQVLAIALVIGGGVATLILGWAPASRATPGIKTDLEGQPVAGRELSHS